MEDEDKTNVIAVATTWGYFGVAQHNKTLTTVKTLLCRPYFQLSHIYGDHHICVVARQKVRSWEVVEVVGKKNLCYNKFMFYLIGLGNPGKEYENTRHNTGRMVVEAFCRAQKFDDFGEDKKTQSLKTEGKISKEKITCLLPETFMNKSGSALKKIITSKKGAGKMIVVHDDVDLALGKFKVSFGKGSAGHKGVESVMRAVKTKDFCRVRIGISPSTPKGSLKKPKGEKMMDFIVGKFKPAEEKILQKTIKGIVPEIEKIISRCRTV